MMGEVFEYAVYLALLVALAIPLSGYLNRVMAGERTVLSRVFTPVENLIYRGIRVDRTEDMGWKRYLVSALAFSAISLVGLFAILMLQGVLPGNPEGLPGLSWDLAFNTAVSFVTNTNWQSYSGESALSYFSQAIGLTVQNFVTPAVGIAVLFALFRGIVAENAPGLGNFWKDATRAVLFVLLPLSLVVAIVDVAQGSPQNLTPYETVQLVEPVGVTADGTIVDADDPAFDSPSKPIGHFMTEEQAKIAEEKYGYMMREDAGRGYRRVVASPKPAEIVEIGAIRSLVDSGQLVIACGGGGIPVTRQGNHLKGASAVIDKDFASELLAEELNADFLIILTAVEKVAVNFGKPEEKWLDDLDTEEARKFIKEGHFAPGSMLPKVQAAVKFAESKPGRTALITLLEKAKDGIQGKTGTHIHLA